MFGFGGNKPPKTRVEAPKDAHGIDPEVRLAFLARGRELAKVAPLTENMSDEQVTRAMDRALLACVTQNIPVDKELLESPELGEFFTKALRIEAQGMPNTTMVLDNEGVAHPFNTPDQAKSHIEGQQEQRH